MHNHVAYCWNKALLKQLFSIFLIFTLYFNSINSAYASTQSLGGWSLGGMVAQGASSVLSASRNVLINGKNIAQASTALIIPSATQVAKLLGKGVAGVAVSVAVEQLLGAVDWVMDPANNQIKYKVPNEANPAIWYFAFGEKFSNISSACSYYLSYSGALKGSKLTSAFETTCTFQRPDGSTVSVQISTEVNPAGEKDEEKTLPLDAVAQQVISNAESGDADAQVATTAAAADIVNDAQNDDAKARPIVNQLDANATTKTDESATAQSKPNTETGGSDLSISFPVFCGWAPTICQAAQTVISFPQTLTNWWDTTNKKADSWAQSISEAWTATKDWFQDEKNDNDDSELPEIKDIDIGQLDTGTFKATAGCPQPIQVPVDIGSHGNVEISYEPICQFASKWSFVAPLIGFLSGAMILVGVGRKGEDGEI